MIDFGDGISKRDIKHIFERFYKGENATSNSIGIGLALAKTIIEEDKGTIAVESNESNTKNTLNLLLNLLWYISLDLSRENYVI